MKHLIILSLLLTTPLISTAQSFNSETSNTQLIELYSSQGCSSCPPAERWISKQVNNPHLWTDIIPMVFHVDYWDYLGWKDPFSNKQHSIRQRDYYLQGNISSVYTPGMIVNGKEWRGWYRGKTLPESQVKPGKLMAELNGQKLRVNYKHKIPLNLNVALLGFSLNTNVKSGENSGKIFSENFIVLNKISKLSNNGTWNLDIDTTSLFNAQRYALAIWINKPDNLKPIQAVGGWIE